MDNMFLRPVSSEDMDLLFRWANNKRVRMNSFSSEMIHYETHKKWFHNVVNSNNVLQYIYCNDHEPIGQVRLDIVGDNAFIDYSISESYRGQGHGENMLKLVESLVIEKHPYIKFLTAQVKDENIASKTIIEKLDYKKKMIEYSKAICSE